MQDTKPLLTICSVCHSPENKELLELNYAFTKAINSERRWRWMVADNTPTGGLAHVLDRNAFDVVPGLPMAKLLTTLPPELHAMKGSYHHATALEGMLPRVTTRFLLILDSDFYIVWPEWIKNITDYMQTNHLAFFDVPWNPRWWQKWRHFPATHALFVDLEQIAVEDLDFFAKPIKNGEMYEPYVLRTSALISFLLRLPLPQAIKKSLKGRLRIHSSVDNGIVLYRKYKGVVAYECVTPVFKPYPTYSSAGRFLRVLFERLIPEQWSYLPRPPVYSVRGFAELGYPSITTAGEGFERAEEFLWHNRPYAFHLRGTGTRLGQEEKTFDWQKKKIAEVLTAFQTYYGT